MGALGRGSGPADNFQRAEDRLVVDTILVQDCWQENTFRRAVGPLGLDSTALGLGSLQVDNVQRAEDRLVAGTALE